MTLTTHSGNVVAFEQRKGKPTKHIWKTEPSLEDLKQFSGWLIRLRKRDLELRRRAAQAEDELQAWRSHAHDLRRQLSAAEMLRLRQEDDNENLRKSLAQDNRYLQEMHRQLTELRGPTPEFSTREHPREIELPPSPPSTENGYPRYIENPSKRDERRLVSSVADESMWLEKWNTSSAAATAAASGNYDEAHELHARFNSPPPKPTLLQRFRAILLRKES